MAYSRSPLLSMGENGFPTQTLNSDEHTVAEPCQVLSIVAEGKQRALHQTAATGRQNTLAGRPIAAKGWPTKQVRDTVAAMVKLKRKGNCEEWETCVPVGFDSAYYSLRCDLLRNGRNAVKCVLQIESEAYWSRSSLYHVRSLCKTHGVIQPSKIRSILIQRRSDRHEVMSMQEQKQDYSKKCTGLL